MSMTNSDARLPEAYSQSTVLSEDYGFEIFILRTVYLT